MIFLIAQPKMSSHPSRGRPQIWLCDKNATNTRTPTHLLCGALCHRPRGDQICILPAGKIKVAIRLIALQDIFILCFLRSVTA